VTLAETQALFHGLVTGDSPPDGTALERCFRGTDELPAAERVAIYRNMYLDRLVDALRETFPNLARFLGAERFAALGQAYLAEHPSEHHDVGRIGRRLAAFLREYPDPERPDLAALAELEWTRNVSFFAPDTRSDGSGQSEFGSLGGLGSSRTRPGALDSGPGSLHNGGRDELGGVVVESPRFSANTRH